MKTRGSYDSNLEAESASRGEGATLGDCRTVGTNKEERVDSPRPTENHHPSILSRRTLLTAVPTLACASPKKNTMSTSSSPSGVNSVQQSNDSLPTIFVAHGAPMLLEDAVWVEELARWARALPKPKAILIISAHWESKPATLGATRTVPLVYDFYGFPERFYQTQYAAPGAPLLAERVQQLLTEQGIAWASDSQRGLDHGAYVPLVAMYPNADVPVLQLSMPPLDPQRLFELGRALAPLREEGILVFGSGFITHNMSYAFRPGTPAWAKEFDAWTAEALNRFDIDALLQFQRVAPAAKIALPTWEHFAPLLVNLGAASTKPANLSYPITGWWMDGAFTRRSVQFT